MPDFVPQYDPNEPLPANADPALMQSAQQYLNGPQGAAFAAAPTQPTLVANAPEPLINTAPNLAPTLPPDITVAPTQDITQTAPPLPRTTTVAQPTHQVTHTGGGGSSGGVFAGMPEARDPVTGKLLNDQQALDLTTKDQSARDSAAKGNVEAGTDLAKQIADAKSKEATEAAQNAQHYSDTIKATQEAGNKWIADANVAFQDSVDAHKAALEEDKTHTVYTGKSDFAKFAAILGLALGGVGSAFSAASGHPTGNVALEQFNKMTEQEFQKQRAHIADLKDDVAMKMTGLHNATDAKAAALTDLNAGQLAQLEVLKAHGVQQLAALGKSAAEIQGNAALNSLDQQIADKKAEQLTASQNHFITKVKTASEIQKNRAEAASAYATAAYHRAAAGGLGAGGDVPAPGSKVDSAIMTKYVNPNKKDAKNSSTQVEVLRDAQATLNDPNSTFGDIKQALMTSLAQKIPGSKRMASVADVKEVLPSMGSLPDTLINEILQGGTNRPSAAYRKSYSNTIDRDAKQYEDKYNREREDFGKKLPTQLSAAARDFYTNQNYPLLTPVAKAGLDPAKAARAKATIADANAPEAAKAGARAYLGQ